MRCLEVGFIAAPGTRLRDEDRTKARELVAMLDELARLTRKIARARTLVMVDAAAGKGYLGVIAAKLVFEPLGRKAEIVLIEREAERLDAALVAAARLECTSTIRGVVADVDAQHAYPVAPDIVAALHACGDAADRVLEGAVEARAAHLLLVPCCVGKATRGTALARSVSDALGLPNTAPIQRRLVHAVVDGERVQRLEAAGYQTEAVEFVPPRVTPYNVLLRARRVGEPRRADKGRAGLATMRAFQSGKSCAASVDEG